MVPNGVDTGASGESISRHRSGWRCSDNGSSMTPAVGTKAAVRSIRYSLADLSAFTDATGVLLYVGRFTAVKRLSLLLSVRQTKLGPVAPLIIWGGHPASGRRASLFAGNEGPSTACSSSAGVAMRTSGSALAARGPDGCPVGRGSLRGRVPRGDIGRTAGRRHQHRRTPDVPQPRHRVAGGLADTARRRGCTGWGAGRAALICPAERLTRAEA